ncbi:MAG: SDR family oxidoreductase [Dialister sp.]|nr:SDR family oxidoreductase [Dialister sp.]
MEKAAILSGGTSGIGLASARALAKRGYVPILAGRDREKGKQAKQVVPESMYIPCDVTDAASVKEFMTAAKALGEIHAVVVSAGIYQQSLLTDSTEEDMKALFDTNVFGAIRFVREAIPYIKKQVGSIVTVASDAALQGNAQCSLYGATKGALLAFTRSLALELSPDGIRANVVCPGDVDTPLLADQIARYGENREEMGKWYPLGRIARAEEIGQVIAFLSSPDASFITGAVLPVDGGLTDW